MLEREHELALVDNAISKNNFQTKRMNSGLQAAIHAAEATSLKKTAYYQAPTRTVLDELAEQPPQRTTNFEPDPVIPKPKKSQRFVGPPPCFAACRHY